MRIALDGSDLAVERFEGPSVYAGELLPRLSARLTSRGHAVTTYAPAPLRGVHVTGEVQVIPGAPFWTQRILTRALWRDRPEVLFLPIQALPVFRPRPLATVAVIHDLEFLRYPETYAAGNRFFLRVLTRDAVRHATKLIAVSQYTKDDVVRVYRRNPDDIAVVHHGVDHRRFAPEGNAQKAKSNTDGAGGFSGLPERFILFVGALQPRKNIVGLLRAYETLSAPPLVLVSGGGWKEEGIVNEIRSSPARSRVHLLRRVTADELATLYGTASVLVLPSFSEGFGMPVLEAMASGTPVITSNTSALPEIAGDAALFVDPRDPETIADAIRRVLRDGGLRAQLREKGFARAAQFTWDRCADATAAVIELAGRHTEG